MQAKRRGSLFNNASGKRIDLLRGTNGRRVDPPRCMSGRRVDFLRNTSGRRVDLLMFGNRRIGFLNIISCRITDMLGDVSNRKYGY